MDWIDLAQDKGQMAGYWEHGYKPLVFKKCGEFLD